MPDIRLEEFVLLSCEFAAWPEQERSDQEEHEVHVSEPGSTEEEQSHEGEAEQVFQYPEGEFLQLESRSSEFGGDYVLVLTASIDDEAFPFRLNLVVGSRFRVSADEGGSKPSLEDAHSTLVWLSYPYLRETVSAISGRSPLPPYNLPAITKMPHPSVTDE